MLETGVNPQSAVDTIDIVMVPSPDRPLATTEHGLDATQRSGVTLGLFPGTVRTALRYYMDGRITDCDYRAYSR